MKEKYILETDTSYKSMVISKDNAQSQVNKEFKLNLLSYWKDVDNTNMGMHRYLDGRLSAMNAITCKVGEGNIEKCD